MKEKNKITINNKLCYLIFFMLEIVLVTYIIRSELGIYFLGRPLIYCKLGLIIIGFDIVFILTILDMSRKENNAKNIFKQYRYEINRNSKRIFCVFLLIKGIIMSLIEEEIAIPIIEIEVILGFAFMIVQLMKKEKEDRPKKIKEFYRQLKSKKKSINYNIILFEDNLNVISSTFEVSYMPSVKVSRKNIYIRYKKEWSFILKKFPEKKEELINHIVVFLKTNKNQNSKEMIKFREYYKREGLNLINNYNILTFDNIDDIKKPEEVESIDSLKMCETKECIEFVENLLKTNRRFLYQVKRRIEYIMEYLFKKAFVKKEYIFLNDQDKVDKITEDLMWTSKEIYDNRLVNMPKIVPKEETLFELYKNSLVQKSIYQSAFILLNYINCMHQEVTYYIYAKNKEDFNKQEINSKIVMDNYDTFAFTLIDYLKPEDLIYKNITQKEYEIDKDFMKLLKYYLSDLIDNKVKGDKVTYFGAIEIMGMIRNKIQAHGSIEQKNILLFWRLIYNLTNLFDEILEIDKFESKKENGKIYFRYNNEEEFLDLGDYIKLDDKGNTFIVQSADSASNKKSNKENKFRYISYLIGKYVKPTQKNLL